MHYVKEFNINGIPTKQVACIELQGKPNAATEGSLGALGIDITSPSHDVYKCVAVNGATYTWELLSSGMSIISSTINSMGEATVQFSYDTLKTPNMYIVKSGDLILDKEGYLYQVASIYSTYCIATYCGTQIAKYGKSGVYMGDEEPTDPEIRVWVDPEGDSYPTVEYQHVANALKGRKSGATVSLTDVSPIGHTLDVRVSSKNLIPFPYKSLRGVLDKGSSDTHNGITYTVNDDGSVTMNGTATGTSIFYLSSSAYSWKIRPGKYVFDSVTNNSYYYSITLIDDVTGATTELNNRYEHNGRIIEIANESTISAYRIAIAQGNNVNNLTVYPQMEVGTAPTEYTPYVPDVSVVKVHQFGATEAEHTEHSVNADGTVDTVSSIYPNTTLVVDTSGAVIDVEYNRDINKAFAELYNALVSMGGNV